MIQGGGADTHCRSNKRSQTATWTVVFQAPGRFRSFWNFRFNPEGNGSISAERHHLVEEAEEVEEVSRATAAGNDAFQVNPGLTLASLG